MIIDDIVAAIESVRNATQDDEFLTAVDQLTLRTSSTHMIFTGVGKSGMIAHRAASSFASLGLPAIYMHAGDAVHGDCGLVRDDDVVIAFSHSGRTPELVTLLSHLNVTRNYRLVLITGSQDGLVFMPDATLRYTARDLLDVVPTASCAAQAAMADSLLEAVTQRMARGVYDFAIHHPGGSLGRQFA